MTSRAFARGGAWLAGVFVSLAACVVLLYTVLFSSSEADQIPDGPAEQALWWAPIAVMAPVAICALVFAARDRLRASIACSLLAAAIAWGWYEIAGALASG